MTAIELSGLVGSNPLGAMAAFGLVRILSAGGATPKVRFVERDDWIAVIDSEHESLDALVAFLARWIRDRATTDLTWTTEDVRVLPDEFRQALHAALQNDPTLAAFLTALATDGAVDKSKQLVKPSRFFMASGQQSFLETLRKLRARLNASGETLWREALQGPWMYAVPEWSGGWDPATERMHALRHQAPTKDKTCCVAGAVWLAYEALPLFPTFSIRGRERTIGFVTRDRETHWRWPLPNEFIGCDTLGVLLAASEVADGKPLRAGVGAIYESTRSEFGQGYAVFRPARRVV